MERKIKALFFDVDGTLVSFRTHRIPQSTVDALEQAKARGVKVYISTGRPVVIITNLGQIEHLVDGYITTNGAHCFVGDDLVCRFPISPSDVQKVLDDSDRQDYPVIVVGERHIAVHNRKPIVDRLFVEGLGVDNLDFSLGVDDLKDEQILQLSPFCSAEQEEAFHESLENCNSGRWHPAFTDITAGEADKGNGLRHMADYLGLDIAETAAFGDGGNDISIIKAAGVGIAMGNAGEEVKEVADYVTTSVDDDGVRNALLHFGVIE